MGFLSLRFFSFIFFLKVLLFYFFLYFYMLCYTSINFEIQQGLYSFFINLHFFSSSMTLISLGIYLVFIIAWFFFRSSFFYYWMNLFFLFMYFFIFFTLGTGVIWSYISWGSMFVTLLGDMRFVLLIFLAFLGYFKKFLNSFFFIFLLFFSFIFLKYGVNWFPMIHQNASFSLNSYDNIYIIFLYIPSLLLFYLLFYFVEILLHQWVYFRYVS